MSRFRFTTLLTTLLLIGLIVSTMPRAAYAVDTFTVSGNNILKNGSVFVAKGANVQGTNWVWPRSITTATGAGGLTDPDLIANIWKFNLIRVNNRFTAPSGSFTDNNDLDAIVNAYTSRGVVVMLATHDLSPGGYYSASTTPTLNQWVTWWRDTALRYKNNPYVWFNVQNEPGWNTPDQQWVTTNQQVIQAIRDTAGASNIIIIDDSAYGQGAGNYDSTFSASNSAVLTYGNQLLNFGGKSYGNIAFSIHTYEQWGYEGAFASDTKLASYIDAVRAKPYALIVGEFGLQNNDAIASNATRSMYNVTASRNVGRVVWHWYGGDGRNSLVNQAYESNPWGGWKIDRTDGTKPTNLSYLGDRVWYDTHNLVWPGDSDLVVTNLKVQQSAWTTGSTINFEVTIKNQGATTAQPAWLNTEFFVDGQYAAYAAANSSLAPGTSVTLTSSGWTASKTTFSLQTNIDTQRRFYESNEGNNSATSSISGGSGPGPNLITNPSFEAEQFGTQTPSGWSEWSSKYGVNASYTESYGGTKSGNYHGTHWVGSKPYNIATYQNKGGLANGLYTLRAWVKSSGGQNMARMYAKNHGGAELNVNISASSSYTQITIANINVTTGTCEIGFWSDASPNQWIYFDDVEFFKQ